MGAGNPGVFQFSLGSLVLLTTGVSIYLAFVRFAGRPAFLFLPSLAGFLMFQCGSVHVFGRSRVNTALTIVGLLVFLFSPILWFIMTPLL